MPMYTLTFPQPVECRELVTKIYEAYQDPDKTRPVFGFSTDGNIAVGNSPFTAFEGSVLFDVTPSGNTHKIVGAYTPVTADVFTVRPGSANPEELSRAVAAVKEAL